MQEQALQTLQDKLGWRLKEEALLQQALTHSTWANEHPGCGADNERLEFLGDAVLGLLVAEKLFVRFPAAKEGELSRRRARLVQRQALAALAQQLGLGDFLRVGEGQRRAGAKESSRLTADAFEAVVGAVFVDGGLVAVEHCFGAMINDAMARAESSWDFKTELQERCHQRGLPAPRYVVSAISGPDHARRYACEVRIGDTALGSGEGSSKKAAEQLCAKTALQHLEEGSP